MQSKAVPAFWKLYRGLPDTVRAQARRQYRVWQSDQFYPSLHFKRISRHEPIYSLRISLNYRALALKDGETFYWFWIGDHAAYEKAIKGS